MSWFDELTMTPEILFITRKWQGYGGMQKLSHDLWKGMEEQGCEARLCIPRSHSAISYAFFVLEAFAKGLRASQGGIHVHFGDAALCPLGWILKKFGRGRVSLTACGLDVTWDHSLYQWMLRRTLPSLDTVVCISPATAEEVERRGVSREKIRVIPCGVWVGDGVEERARVREGPVLVTIGRLVPRKGVAWFLEEVLPLLLQKYSKLQYWIIGFGPEKKMIQKIVQERGLTEVVRLFGGVSGEEKERILREADLLVSPNVPVRGDMEGFGIVCIEASSLGLPVAASRLEGLTASILPGKTGEFFRPGDAEDAYQVITQMLEYPMDPTMVSQETLKVFSWEHLMGRYCDEVFRPLSPSPVLSRVEGLSRGERGGRGENRIGMVTWDFEDAEGRSKGGLGIAMKEIATVLKPLAILTPQQANCQLPLRFTRRFGGHILFSLLLPLVLRRWMRKHTIFHLLLPVGPGGVFFLRMPPKDARVTAICYHTYLQQSRAVPGESWKKIFIPLERRTLRFASNILCYSADTERVLREEYGLLKVRLLPQLFSMSYRGTNHDIKEAGLCLCIARLERRKGVEILLRAWKRVEEAHPEARLTIVGDGRLVRRIDRLVRECARATRIPYLPREELTTLLSRAEILVAPSYLEGFGLTVLEAMAAGTAVIGCDSDGIRSLIEHGRNGVLVPRGDPELLAEAIITVLEERERREEIMQKAKRRVLERFKRSEAEQALRECMLSYV